MAQVKPTKSRAPFLLILVAIVVAGAGGIYYKMQSSKSAPIVLAPGTALPKAEGYLRGNANAPVTIIEFGDFECPGCGQFANVTEPDVRSRIVDAGLASFRFYDFPLTQIHMNTMSASLAAACAADQGKFWEMHDALFRNQNEWNTQATANPKKVIANYVKAIGLNEDEWNKCFDSQKDVARIEAHHAAGLERNVPSTPTFIIGDQMISSALTYDGIKKIVDSLIAAKAPATAPPVKK
ncbi:MAG: thioredoxin domain-containing protein [Gemmatimonadaceae bacterium]